MVAVPVATAQPGCTIFTECVNTAGSGGAYNLSLSFAAGSENGWTVMSNPYPSPILVSSVVSSAGGGNIDNTFQIYDPDTDSNVPYTAAGSNSIIPMGQAFMIRALFNNVNFIQLFDFVRY